MKRYIGEIYDQLKNILQNRKRRVSLGLAIFAGTSLTICGVKGLNSIRNKQETEVTETAEVEVKDYREGIITSSYTNMYEMGGIDNNKIEKEIRGKLVEFESTSEAYYNEVDGEWKVVKEEEEQTHTLWIQCKVNENEGYMPSDYVDKYYPYSVSEATNFYVEKDETVDNLEEDKEEITIQNARVWVCEDDSNEKGLSKAIIRDKSDNYLTGYIDASVLEKDLESSSCVGRVNTETFLRYYPLVVELDESIIVGKAINGQRVKIVDTKVCGSGDMKETWYECEIPSEKEHVYIADYAIKDIKDFDKEIVFSGIEGKVNNKAGTETRITIYEGDTVKVDTKNIANGVCPVYIEGKDRCSVGYMDVESLDLEENIQKSNEENLIPVNEEKTDKLTYIMDFGSFDNYDGFIETMNDLIEKDMLAGVIFRIGATSQLNYDDNGEPIGFRIISFVDDQEEFEDSGRDVKLLNDGYEEIKQKSEEHGEKVRFTGSLGSIKEFEKFIKAVNNAGLAWGCYYYQGSANANRASVEAAYIYNVMDKVKSDLGVEYTNSKKLPFMFDLESVQSAQDEDKKRLDAVRDTQRLLGHGIDSNQYWTIKGIKPEEGYNLSSDYNDQFMFYSAIIPTCKITSNSLIEMEEELNKEGYRMIYNSSRKINFEKSYEEIMEIPELRDYANEGFEWYKNEYRSYDQWLCDRSDLVQVFLDVKAWNGKLIDLSLTSQGTIDKIVAGTYKHEKNYFEILNDAVAREEATQLESAETSEEQATSEEIEIDSSDTGTTSFEETKTSDNAEETKKESTETNPTNPTNPTNSTNPTKPTKPKEEIEDDEVR